MDLAGQTVGGGWRHPEQPRVMILQLLGQNLCQRRLFLSGLP
ncbi:hypothetical protein [Streptomyces sp. KCTC 0041BP]|nr:hypothetical protein [Streptomyces sp. KCTC 0041BP]